MTGRRIALERFWGGAGPDEPADSAAADAAPAPAPAPAPEPAPVAPAPEDLAAARAMERLARLDHIARSVELIAAEQASLRHRTAADAAAALGAAAATLLPRLARAGFAELVAETVATLALRGHWPALELAAHAGDVDELGQALARGAPKLAVSLAADPALGPGEVRIGWQGGGAEIDADALAAAALDIYARRLEACAHEGDQA